MREPHGHSHNDQGDEEARLVTPFAGLCNLTGHAEQKLVGQSPEQAAHADGEGGERQQGNEVRVKVADASLTASFRLSGVAGELLPDP